VHQEITSNVAIEVMDQLPPDAPKDGALKMTDLPFEAGAAGKDLGAMLVWSVNNNYRAMVASLVAHEVSLDRINAQAVRTALKSEDMVLLKLLLNGGNESTAKLSTHSPAVLAEALNDALVVSDKSTRHRATLLLLDKGISGMWLDWNLLSVVSKPHIRGLNLIRALHEAGANVNRNHGHGIKLALQLSDTTILNYFCTLADVNPDSFTALLPLGIDCCRHDQSKLNIVLKANHGYHEPTNIALVKEVKSDPCQHEIIDALLASGANVNFRRGELFAHTIRRTPLVKYMKYLQLFLTKSADAEALNTAFDTARELECDLDQRFDLY
jgi:hypothetical protein